MARLYRRILIGLLVALPCVDVAMIVYSSGLYPGGSRNGGSTVVLVDALSAMCFWVALCALARIVFALQAANTGVLARIGGGGFLLLLAIIALYHGLYWGFIAANGHRPSPDALVFLADNALRLPHHIFQTAPLAAVAGIAASLVAAALMAGVARKSLPPVQPRQLRQEVILLATFLVAWQAVATAGTGSATTSTFLDADRVAQARARLAVQALPDRAPTPSRADVLTDRPSFVVILVESLRHDLLVDNPEAIPFIRSMYQNHTGFERAYATASHSNLSDLAFWYSQYPLRGHAFEAYPPDAEWRGVSLFELFKQHGYNTAYISSQNEKWGGMINWLKIPAVDHFFDSESFDGKTWENFDDTAGLAGLMKSGFAQAGKIEDSETIELAQQWIDSLEPGSPFFLGMNLQNTHFSYVLSPGAEAPYQPSDLGFRAVYYRWPESMKGNVRNRYLNSVKDVDQLLERFATFLQSKGLWENLVLVVVGDNGEGFYEHGFGNHSGPMYDEAVHTLAFIKARNQDTLQRGSHTRALSHIDIAATIPDIAGIPRPWSFQGRSILADECNGRPVFMYSNAIVRQFGVVSWPWKLLLTEYPVESVELFDLSADPDERQNLATQQPAAAARMRSDLERWVLLQSNYYSSSSFLTKSAPDHCPD